MKNIFIRMVMVATFVSCGPLLWAHDGIAMPSKPGSADFEKLKLLVGKWEGTSTPMGPHDKAGPVATEFHLTAAGSAVEENLMKGTPHEMVDMYTDEEGRLAMKHYCAMGNQPHMVTKSSGPHDIVLEMTPTPGIAANDMHMHALTLEFPDANHLTERWTNYSNGKPGETVIFTLTRAK